MLGGVAHPGKRHEHGDQALGDNGIEANQTGQAIENTAQKNSRHLCQLLNCPCRGMSAATQSAGLSCPNGMLRGGGLVDSSISFSGYWYSTFHKHKAEKQTLKLGLLVFLFRKMMDHTIDRNNKDFWEYSRKAVMVPFGGGNGTPLMTFVPELREHCCVTLLI